MRFKKYTPKPLLYMNITSKQFVTGSFAVLLALSSATAVTSVSSSFNAGPVGGVVDITGASSWGYVSVDNKLHSIAYDSDDFSSINDPANLLATVDPTYQMGDVTITTDGDGMSTRTNKTYTFDGSDAFGRFGSLAPVEDAFTLHFNDLGVGTFEIMLYLGHSANDRTFDMDYEFFENGSSAGAAQTTVTPNPIGDFDTQANGLNLFTYTISFTTSEADTDLALSWASTGGGAGDGAFAGYTVTTIPESSSYALISGLLALGAIMTRRRKL